MTGLSDGDMERIEEFNRAPWYAKDPEILVPTDEDEAPPRAEASD
jgi:hypothetical protein